MYRGGAFMPSFLMVKASSFTSHGSASTSTNCGGVRNNGESDGDGLEDSDSDEEGSDGDDGMAGDVNNSGRRPHVMS